MDVLDRVRDIGGEIELTEAQVAQARRKVLDGLGADASRPSRRRLWIGIGGIGGVVAAATAATAIVIAVTTPQAAVVEAVTPTPSAPPVVVTPPPVTTPPTEIVGAAAVLEHAAELAPLESRAAARTVPARPVADRVRRDIRRGHRGRRTVQLTAVGIGSGVAGHELA